MDDNTHTDNSSRVDTDGWYCLCSIWPGFEFDLLWFVR